MLLKKGLGVVNCEQKLGGFEEKIITLLDGSVSQFVLQRSILSGSFRRLATERFFHPILFFFFFPSLITHMVSSWVCFSYLLLIVLLIC